MSADGPNPLPIAASPGPEVEIAGANIKWKPESRGKAIVETMKKWHEKGKMTDITINCEGQLIHAHALVLASVPYFRMLLEDEDAQKAECLTIILAGVRYESVKALIEFMYTGKTKVSRSVLDGLLDVTKLLRIQRLGRMLASYLEPLTPKTPVADRVNDSSMTAIARAMLMLGNGRIASKLGRKRLRDSTVFDQSDSTVLDRPRPESQVPLPCLAVVKAERKKARIRGKTQKRKLTPTVRELLKKRKDDDDLGKYTKPSLKLEPPVTAPVPVPEDSLPLVPYFEHNSNSNSGNPLLQRNPDPHWFTFMRRLASTPSPTQSTPIDLSTGSGNGGGATSPGVYRPAEASLTRHVKQSPVHDEHGNAIRRPPNAFMMFSNAKRKQIASENPNLNNNQVSKLLGQMWKQLEREGQHMYYKEAREALDKHKKMYPNYVYSPQEARIRKELKRSNNTKSPVCRRLYENILHAQNEDTNSSGTLTADEDIAAANHFLLGRNVQRANGSGGTGGNENDGMDSC